MYVASNHFVWRLVPVSIASQIRQLLQDKQFELALQLAVSSSITTQKLLQTSLRDKFFTDTYHFIFISSYFFPVSELKCGLDFIPDEHCNKPYSTMFYFKYPASFKGLPFKY